MISIKLYLYVLKRKSSSNIYDKLICLVNILFLNNK